MSEKIFNPDYWRVRLENAPRSQRHHAIFRCPLVEWLRIEESHREILARHIRPADAVLDAGCAWGRLITLLPGHWRGPYLGIDISPDFIELARKEHPNFSFEVADLCDLEAYYLGNMNKRFDWAVMISMRPMIRRHMGEETWSRVQMEVETVARRILFLEYDENDPGEVLQCRSTCL